RTQRWEAVKLHAEPTTHRMRWIKTADGKWGLVVVPLHGRGNKNGEGAGVKVLLYHKPDDLRAEWKTELIDASMHMTHNFDIARVDAAFSGRTAMLAIGGREGIAHFRWRDGIWQRRVLAANEGAEDGCRGVGELRVGRLGQAEGEFVASVEPMHGNELAVYVNLPKEESAKPTRIKLTDKLVEGHALACGDLLGLGSDQIVVGWRGNPSKAGAKVGIQLWTPLDPEGAKWRETLIDDNTMACEDLVLADLDADGKLEIIAAGRATKNLKVYFNER
nr:hypothetical protein [Verrucomicrobiota bacterium]